MEALTTTKQLLRFSTAGSVDDGKSTLIGRLLFDTNSIFEDQLEAIVRSTKIRGRQGMDLSLLTDGLEAEREQGITIDVAYRYFSTATRKFIIADTPGHEQYTRNMVTGASTSDLALILIDASRGLKQQARRHFYISRLLGIRHFVICINKMDLVEFDKDTFTGLVAEFTEAIKSIADSAVTFIPVSALLGDNIAQESGRMPWYQGPTLLQFIEAVDVDRNEAHQDMRFPVQYVNRPDSNFRGYAGTITSGGLTVGDELVVMPSMQRTLVRRIFSPSGEVSVAKQGDAITMEIAHDLDVSRGDIFVRAGCEPVLTREIKAQICWMSAELLDSNRKYLLKHCCRTVQVKIDRVVAKIDVSSFASNVANDIGLNDIAEVCFKLAQALPVDDYRIHRATGSFILIDAMSYHTVAAGMIQL